MIFESVTNMEKKIQSALLCFLTGIIFINLLVFIIPFSRGYIFWIAYIFLMLSLVVELGMYYVILKKDDLLKDRIQQYPLLRICYIYLAIQLVTSIVFFITDGYLSSSLYWVPLVICILILGVSCGLFAISYLSLEKIREIHDAEVAKTTFVKNLTLEIDILRKKTVDPVMQEKLFQFYEMVKYSDPVSSPALLEIEQDIFGRLQILQSVLARDDFTQADHILQKLILLMDERNQRCKMLK